MIALTVVMLLALSYQVVMRYVFNHASSWSEELAVTCFSWSMLLAIAAGVRDGNLHFNVLAPPGTDATAFAARQDEINRVVHDRVAACEGSISAEHGLGQLRRDENARYKSPLEMSLMHAVKAALDPLGLMNPDKVLAAL